MQKQVNSQLNGHPYIQIAQGEFRPSIVQLDITIWLCILQLVTMRLLTLYIGTHYSQLWNIYTNSVYSMYVDNTCLLFIDCCCLNPDTPAPLTLPSRAIEIRNGDGSTDWSRRSSPSPVIIKPIRPKPKGKPAATQAQPSWGFRKPPSVPTLSSDKVRDSGGSKCRCCINFTVLSLDVDLFYSSVFTIVNSCTQPPVLYFCVVYYYLIFDNLYPTTIHQLFVFIFQFPETFVVF